MTSPTALNWPAIAASVFALVFTAAAFLALDAWISKRGEHKKLSTRYRLRTLVILTAVAPPLMWVAYLLLKPPGRLFWVMCFLVSLLICTPFAMLRLNMFRIKM